MRVERRGDSGARFEWQEIPEMFSVLLLPQPKALTKVMKGSSICVTHTNRRMVSFWSFSLLYFPVL